MAISIKQLESKINQLNAKKKALQALERRPAIARIVAQMREFGIGPNEISSAFNSDRRTSKARAAKEKPAKLVKTKKPVEPKYRNADTGESWSGRGKPPRWLAASEASGKSRESFRMVPAQPKDLPPGEEGTHAENLVIHKNGG
jgi:DNA-binding protein H-NS